jgi:hypothetical protein
MVYLGGASLELQVTLAKGKIIPVKVTLNEFKGMFQARIPSERWEDMIGFTFVDDPGLKMFYLGLTFKVDAPLTILENGPLRGVINKLLSNLMRRTFLDLFTLPAWRTNYFPHLDPGWEEMLRRNNMDKAMDANEKKVC